MPNSLVYELALNRTEEGIIAARLNCSGIGSSAAKKAEQTFASVVEVKLQQAVGLDEAATARTLSAASALVLPLRAFRLRKTVYNHY